MLELGRWIDVAGLEPRPRWSPRLVAMALVVCLAMALVFQRLFVLQVIEGRTFIAAADANHTRRVVLEAERGVVYDRHGNQLVVNQPSWTLEVIPGALPSDPRQRSRALDSLASAGGVPVTDLRARVGGAADPYSAVPVRQHLDARQAQVAAERLPELPGARLRQQPYRSYVDAPVFSHLLGYTGPLDPREAAALKPQGYQPTEWLGRAGIEAGAEAQLRGQDGWAGDADAAVGPGRLRQQRLPEHRRRFPARSDGIPRRGGRQGQEPCRRRDRGRSPDRRGARRKQPAWL
jgi:penicillin-binding protein 2